MKSIIRYLITGIVSSVSLSAVAYAADTCVVIQRGAYGAVDDALINSVSPNKNYGASNSWTAGTENGGPRNYALARFDLSSIPPNVVVTSATLTATVLVGGGIPTDVHRVTAPWNESSVTWNSFSNAYDPQIRATLPAATVNQKASANLTELVQSFVNGTLPNHGLLLRTNSAGMTVYASSEYIQSYRPSLKVCYAAASTVLYDEATWDDSAALWQ